ncbi:chromosome partitioning protein [Limimonas halophila]|uniref:Chromosome partitioning protein n=1 Tax=Limimonas halophila TaxID=1082479 RepID=A0A1G7RJK1_9PROT|nr:ParA family protein [Limimonas halophila]SDG10379.1 chromosome partitioning protein [Limimonas halophila]
MHVLTLASQKGGSGKTTLAGHLAVQAARSGFGRVAVIDTDPQGSLSDWWNARADPTPEFAETVMETLQRDLTALATAGVDLLVVDTPPAITDTIESVIRLSDLVVVPTRPSPHDLRAAGATVDLVEGAGKPLVFVVNAGKMRARITGEAAVALSQHGTVAPATIHQRNDFAASMIDGRTAADLDASSRSAREVAELWSYLANRLRGERRETVLTGAREEPAKTPLTPAGTEA